MEAGRPAAGSSRAGAHRASTIVSPWRLDPFSLPARFISADAAADQGLRVVDLHRERVVVRRALAGMRMAVNLPVAAYRGIAIRLDGMRGKLPPIISVTLEHADAALSLPLFASADADEIVAEWQAWSACSACRFWSARATALCAKSLPASVGCGSRHRHGGAGGGVRLRADVPRGCCAAKSADRRPPPSCIAAKTKSSRRNNFKQNIIVVPFIRPPKRGEG